MTDTLARLTEEVRKLTPLEVDQLRTWIVEYQPAKSKAASRRVDWSAHAARVQAIFGDAAPARGNAVLALREEQMF